MPGFIAKFEITTPMKFRENGCDTEFEAVAHGAIYVNEYDESVYGAQNEAIAKLKEMAAGKVRECLEHWHEGDKPLFYDGRDEVGRCLIVFLKENGVSGSARIDELKITDATNDAYQELIVKPYLEFKKEKRRREIEAANVPHGPLRSFSYSLSSHGMMAGTSSGSTRSVDWKDDGTIIYSYSSYGSGRNVNTEYKIAPGIASKVVDLVAEEKIAALANMEIELPAVFDNFTSSTISMVFDDSSLGGDSYNHCTLNCGASGMSFGTIEKKVSALLDEIEKSGECIKNEMTETPGMFGGMPGMIGMFGMMNNGGAKTGENGPGVLGVPGAGVPCGSDLPVPDLPYEQPVQLMGLVPMDPNAGRETAPVDGLWTCSCGHKNSGKFCADCGSPKPDGWVCKCGEVNTGKFCMNCGRSRE